MSIGARALIEQQDLSWADETGQARIVAAPALAVLRAAPKPHPSPVSSFRWSASSGAVAEVMLSAASLTRGTTLPPAAALAGALPWSVTQVHKVLQAFDGQGWTERGGPERGRGAVRLLAEPGDLLSAWARWHSERAHATVKLHALWRDPRDFAATVLTACLPARSWCATGWLAAAEIAPYATAIPDITCYVDSDLWDAGLDSLLTQLEQRAGARLVATGSRLHLVRAEPQVLTLARPGPIPLAAPARVYADLLLAGSRGEAAAEHLRETALGI